MFRHWLLSFSCEGRWGQLLLQLFLNLRNLYHAIKFEIQWSKRFSGTFLKANIENARLALALFLLAFCNGRLTVGNQSNFGVTRPDLNFSFFTTYYSDYVNHKFVNIRHNHSYLKLVVQLIHGRKSVYFSNSQYNGMPISGGPVFAPFCTLRDQ